MENIKIILIVVGCAMQKIIYMLTTVFYPSIGGVENHIYNLSINLVKIGYKVKIINPVINLEKNEIYDLEGIEVNRIAVGNENDLKKYEGYKKNSKDSILGYFYGYRRKNYYNKFYKIIYKYIINDIRNQKNCEIIIHQHDFISSIKLSRKLSKKYNIIFTNHTGEFLFLKKLPFSNFIIKYLTKHFKYIIAPSNELARFEKIRDKNTYRFLSNGVDIERFKIIDVDAKNKLKQKYNIPLNKKIVFCPRRWAPTKGIIYLVKSIDLLVNENKRNDLLFIFAGNEYNDYPEYVAQINKIIEDKNLKKSIKLLGNVKYNLINEIMSISDLIVIPSLMEAISLAALEGMACGKIVIGTNVGGFPQVINNGENGFLVPPKNEIELSKIINKITLNIEDYNYIGDKARKFIEDGYSWNSIAKKTSLIYEKYFNHIENNYVR